MSESSSASNPFAALVVEQPSDSGQQQQLHGFIQTPPVNHTVFNAIIETIFRFTLNKNTKATNEYPMLYLEDLAASSLGPQDWIDEEVLKQALFERLLIPNPQKNIIPPTAVGKSEDGFDNEIVPYLYGCYLKLRNYQDKKNIVHKIESLIMRNLLTALKQPELYSNQNLYEQLLQLVSSDNQYKGFFMKLAKECKEDEDTNLKEIFYPLFQQVHNKMAKFSLVSVNKFLFEFLKIIASIESLADILIEYCTPKDVNLGSGYANTLFGAFLTISILPKINNGQYEFFDRPVEQIHTSLEGDLWSATENITEDLYQFFYALLKCSENIRSKTLVWFANCLHANESRGKLWNAHAPPGLNPANFTTVGDGFMLNLSVVLLKLCIPFCSNLASGKILKVDPTYCAVAEPEEGSKLGVHLNLSGETCLLPSTKEDCENYKRPTAQSYSFISECFYMAHRSLDLGFRLTIDNLLRLNHEMLRLQRAFDDAFAQGGGMSDVVTTIKTRMESEMQGFFSIKAALMEPTFISNLMKLHTATSFWLTQVAIHPISEKRDVPTFAPTNSLTVTFPLPSLIPDSLRCVPEFIVENVVGYLSFLRRFSPRTLEEEGFTALEPILTMVLAFMGSPERVKNPHLRARLAECLESMLPRHKDEEENLNPFGGFQREKLFTDHPHRHEIARSLLSVFVGIEMTGQSVQFEQKFNYRRPMYLVMDYLWELEEHRNSFIALGKEAEENMEAVNPPIFLRFVNLLMNDAVFLLDESLSNMAQIRTLETARENGEWDSLAPREREQNIVLLRQTGMLARFDNILGKDTTRTLRLLTAHAPSVFTHSTMVDRVAAMLNYFLLHLVGPKKKNLKVKDMKEYEFEPAKIVLDICHIYVALAKSEAFCRAVSQDGRSYSPQLFIQAENVLARIGGGDLISDLREAAVRVDDFATQQKADEEALADVPEEFLDPIMSTLMLDPVILPSSKQTVDRTTIARHLLSDQTDPFNRSPLTMDQVISNTELAENIHAWVKERKEQAKNMKVNSND